MGCETEFLARMLNSLDVVDWAGPYFVPTTHSELHPHFGDQERQRSFGQAGLLDYFASFWDQ
jgi:hypothetical protein